MWYAIYGAMIVGGLALWALSKIGVFSLDLSLTAGVMIGIGVASAVGEWNYNYSEKFWRKEVRRLQKIAYELDEETE